MSNEGLVIVDNVVKDGKKCSGEVVIPEGVKEIANLAFYQNKNLTGLYISDGVEKIGNYIVNGCINLEYVRVPDSLTKVGDGGLVKKIESNAGFTHVIESKEYYPVIRCHKGSYIDNLMNEQKSHDGWVASHSNEHIVKFEYEM